MFVSKNLTQRRRSMTTIPPNRHGNFQSSNPYEVHDRLTNIPIIPKPTRRSHILPTLKKFMNGKSSLYSVAAALTNMHHEQRGISSSISQCKMWTQSDGKEHLQKINESHRNAPALPKSLSVRLKVSRSSACNIIDQGFLPFKYKDFEEVFLFIKIKDMKDIDSIEKFHYLIHRATLNSCTVAIFVGAWKLGGNLPMRAGLGKLYLSNGRVINGEAALAMRVASIIK